MGKRNHPARTQGRRWAALRWAILERDGWLCRTCGKAGRLECDHIRAVALGGEPWDPVNLQALCRACHFTKSRNERGQDPTRPERVAWAVYLRDCGT